jgi:hypothetical protein
VTVSVVDCALLKKILSSNNRGECVGKAGHVILRQRQGSPAPGESTRIDSMRDVRQLLR